MNGLLIALLILAALFLLGQIRIGAQVEYCDRGLFVRVRAGRVLVRVFPPKTDKKKRQPAKQKKVPAEQKSPKGGKLSLALKFLPLVLKTVGKLRRKVRVDQLEMELIIAASDPADAAIRYGQANAILGTLWQPVTQVFHVKDGHAHVGVDFESETPALYILASVSLTIAQALGLILVFAIKGLGVLIRNRTGRNASAEQGEVFEHGI